MKKGFFSERPRFPTDHSCRRNGNPIDPAGLICEVSTNLLKTLPPEQLATAGHVVLPFKTVSLRTVALASRKVVPATPK